jgi:hypothetical protein
MEFSIINVLDDHFAAKEGVAVKIIIQKDGAEDILFNGNSDFIGQVVIPHQSQGMVSLFFDEKFHSNLNLPCFKTIVIKK